MSDDTIKKNISKNICKYREKKGMSQKELAQKLGVVPSRISNWETGANCPTIDILFEVCDVLDVSINDIYGIYSGSKFVLQSGEQELLEKYRALDEHGKENVDCILENEYKRCTHIDSRQLSIFDLVGSEDIAELKKVTQLPDVHFSEEFDKLFNQLASKKDTIPFRMEPSYDIVNAAHARTDISITNEDVQNDKDIMDDENF